MKDFISVMGVVLVGVGLLAMLYLVYREIRQDRPDWPDLSG